MASGSSFALAHLGAALALALLPGCVEVEYDRARVFQEPPPERVDALVVGESDVGQSVAALGAPLHVIEVGLGLALAWGWQDVTGWNVDVSAPLGDAQGNFSYTSSASRTRGVVLFFGPDWRLTAVRRGFLAQLLPDRQKPRDVDDDLQP